MLIGIARPLIIAAAGLWLAGCTTSSSFSNLFGPKTPGADASASAQVDETSSEPHLTVDGSAPVQPVEELTGSVTGSTGRKTAPGLLGSDPNDELNLGKKHYRANNFGLAEKHFRLAVEKHPRDAEAWLGLAASYDRLRRFDLADRAYCPGRRDPRPDGRDSQQSGLLIHAARRLQARARNACRCPAQGSEQQVRPKQSPAS